MFVYSVINYWASDPALGQKAGDSTGIHTSGSCSLPKPG